MPLSKIKEFLDKLKNPVWFDGFIYGVIAMLTLISAYSSFSPLIFSWAYWPYGEFGVIPLNPATLDEDTGLIVKGYEDSCIMPIVNIKTTGQLISGTYCIGDTIFLKKWDITLKRINSYSDTITFEKKRKFRIPWLIPAALIGIIALLLHRRKKPKDIIHESLKTY